MGARSFALDTSCMVAAVCGWHEHHAAAADAIEARLERGDDLTVAAHALAETYAVLTRFPSPHRLAPEDAWTLVEANFVSAAQITALSARDYVRLIAGLARAGTAGGRTFDSIIADCARRAGADTLITFNPRHFEPAPPGLAVVVPA